MTLALGAQSLMCLTGSIMIVAAFVVAVTISSSSLLCCYHRLKHTQSLQPIVALSGSASANPVALFNVKRNNIKSAQENEVEALMIASLINASLLFDSYKSKSSLIFQRYKQMFNE